MSLYTLLLILAVCAMARGKYTSMGCLRVSTDHKVLKHREFQSKDLTHQMCYRHCKDKSYVFFGLLERDKCFCGNKLKKHRTRIHMHNCARKCTGNRRQHCGGDKSMLVFSISDSVEHNKGKNAWFMKSSKLSKTSSAKSPSNRRVPLFAIRANTGRRVLDEYNHRSSSVLPPGAEFPDSFRSDLLDDLPAAIRTYSAKRIVVEMQKGGKMVAKAEFDVTHKTRSLNSQNWFDQSRLKESYPISTNGQHSYVDFSINGYRHASDMRRFYIHYAHRHCDQDIGLMGIGDSTREVCSWVTNGGRRPVLFYATKSGKFVDVVNYADKFVIYLI